MRCNRLGVVPQEVTEPMFTALVPALVFALTGSAARAQDAGDIQGLLNSIPDIQVQKPVEDADKPPPPPPSMDLPTYTGIVRSAVMANWHPPAKLVAKHPELAAQYLVVVKGDGTLGDLRAVRNSGNNKFDKSVVDALFDTTSVEAPPAGLAATVLQGVLVTFSASAK